MRPSEADLGPVKVSPAMATAIVITAAGVLYLGIFPGGIYNLAMNSMKIFASL